MILVHACISCRLLVALSLTLVCTVVELAGFFSGLSMFTSLPNLFCILPTYASQDWYTDKGLDKSCFLWRFIFTCSVVRFSSFELGWTYCALCYCCHASIENRITVQWKNTMRFSQMGILPSETFCLPTPQQTQQTTFKQTLQYCFCVVLQGWKSNSRCLPNICLLPNLLPRPLSCSAFSTAWVQRSSMQSGSGVGKGLETRLPWHQAVSAQ